jgi:hypothetical protein
MEKPWRLKWPKQLPDLARLIAGLSVSHFETQVWLWVAVDRILFCCRVVFDFPLWRYFSWPNASQA